MDGLQPARHATQMTDPATPSTWLLLLRPSLDADLMTFGISATATEVEALAQAIASRHWQVGYQRLEVMTADEFRRTHSQRVGADIAELRARIDLGT